MCLGINSTYEKDVEGWLNLVHPDDRDKMEKYLALHVISEQNLFDKEYRIITKDTNKEKWVHGLGELRYDNNNMLTHMIGTIQDIHNQKMARAGNY